MTAVNWQKCVQALQGEISQGQFNTWIRPLSAELEADGKLLWVKAPNRFILDWVSAKFLVRIRELMFEIEPGLEDVALEVEMPNGAAGAREKAVASGVVHAPRTNGETARPHPPNSLNPRPKPYFDEDAEHIKNLRIEGELNRSCNFSNFVVGQSNQLAHAAAFQVARNPGQTESNPLFIYGGVGLGKTHLMHAIGNQLRERKPHAKVGIVDCENFVNTLIRALRFGAMDWFKRYYRSVDALLLDDVHFLEKKERSEEEFFHTFNTLLDNGVQVVLTSDRYYKEIHGIKPRLMSRLGWGLSVAIEAPELETRVAISMSKAAQIGLDLPDAAAEFIARKVCSGGRELEGAIKKVKAYARFKGRQVDVDVVKEALWDLLAQQDKLISIDNIQRTVAQYYKINMRDMLSKRRNRSVTRPRQVAMSLTRQLTSHSLPEIGEAFGGRDHTTVLHACRQVSQLRRGSKALDDDFNNLMRILTN